jgi:hypothetical protein
LSEHYCDKKKKEFFELKLGSMTMDKYERRFLELLRYVGFIKDEKVKIKIFLNGIPLFYNDKIHFDEPNTLAEAIRKKSIFMSKIKEGQFFKRLGMTRRKTIWNKEINRISDHSLEIVLRDNEYKMKPG